MRRESIVAQIPVFFLVHRVIQALPLGSRIWPAAAIHLAKALAQACMPKVADGLGFCLASLLLFSVCIV